MVNCICSYEWLLSYDIGGDYIAGKQLTHSPECDANYKHKMIEYREHTLIERWKWVTATNESCNNRYSHGPHGTCSGQAFDRT